MSDQTQIAQIASRASLIEQLTAEGNLEALGGHLTELETVRVTEELLQQTGVLGAVDGVLRNCPSAALKRKAKRLLSEWKALYKDPHFKPRDSPKFLCTGGNEKNSGLSYDSSQDKIVGGSSPDSLPSSQDVLAKATEMPVPENSPSGLELKEEHVRGGDPTSNDEGASGLDAAVRVRTKCTELLAEALANSAATDQPKAELWQNFAREIEEHIFTLYSKNLKKYKTCIRSKVANLKNPQNSHLQQNLLSGTMSPREFAQMTVMDMASPALKRLRASYTESGIREHCLPQVTEGTRTEKIKCRRCEKFNCKVTAIARGTLFLPSWVRRSNPDEEMMTYAICNECGEQWYHSDWVCL
ncbi:transcription elongation factor A N-terminal and central domain-containing protein isoform X2 [Saccopteryx leptura]